MKSLLREPSPCIFILLHLFRDIVHLFKACPHNLFG